VASPGATGNQPAPVTVQSGAATPAAQTTQPGETPEQRLAAVTRREVQFRAQQRQAQIDWQKQQDQFKAFEARVQKMSEDLEREKQAMSEARRDPMKWLQYGGHTYDALTQQVAADGNVPPEILATQMQRSIDEKLEASQAELDRKLQEEKDAREAFQKSEKDRQEQEATRQVEEFHAKTIDFVTSHGDDYELINMFGIQSQVPDLIDRYYRQTLEADKPNAVLEGRNPVGRILDPKDAAEIVEKHVEKQWEQAQQSKKIQAKLKKPEIQAQPGVAPTVSVVTPQVQQPVVEQPSPGQRTLNNGASQIQTPAPNEWVPENVRWQRALAAMDSAKRR